MAFLHPPYWDMVRYSKNPQDLSKQNYQDFLNSFVDIAKECKRILKTDSYLVILVGDIIRNGKFIPLTRHIANLMEGIGLQDCGYAVKLTRNSVSQRVRGKAIYAEVAATRNLKVNHDVIMFWKKA